MRNYAEDSLQQAAMQYIRLQYPHLLAFHVPNGGKRDPREAARLKLQGVLPGVADILVFWSGGMGAIELKAGKNKTTPKQDYFADRWEWVGGKYAICYGMDEVIEVLEAWNIV